MLYIISAHRAGRSAEENQNQTTALQSMITFVGGLAFPARGFYRGTGEDSFVVLGLTQARAIELGRLHEQESILEVDDALESRLLFMGSVADPVELGRLTPIPHTRGIDSYTELAGVLFTTTTTMKGE